MYGSLLLGGITGEVVLIETIHPHLSIVLFHGLQGFFIYASLENREVILWARARQTYIVQ